MRRASAGPAGDPEDRLQRALQENRQLKTLLKERDEKLKRVQTQFQRLAADWKRSHGGEPSSPSALSMNMSTTLPSLSQQHHPAPSMTVSSPYKKSSFLSAVATAPSSPGMKEELNTTRAALAAARSEVQHLREQLVRRPTLLSTSAAPSSAPAAAASAAAAVAKEGKHTDIALAQARIEQLVKERVAADQELQITRQQLLQAQSELQRIPQGAAAGQLDQRQQIAALTQQLQLSESSRKQQEDAFRSAMDNITREKEALTVRVKAMLDDNNNNTTNAGAAGQAPIGGDPMGLVQLQNDVHEKSNQMRVLSSRLQYAQSQVETLKGECTRLVDELKKAHAAHADVKKEMFKIEHEKNTLAIQASRLHEVELVVQRKEEEVLGMEKELLKLMEALRTCNHDTEQAVRREMNARVTELQQARDEAEQHRRDVERALITTQHDLSDAQRKVDGLAEDVATYRSQCAKLERSKAELSSHVIQAGHTASDFTDDEVHRVFAVAALRKRSQREAANAADSAVDLYDALNWDETWEQGQLREAVATAALDMELAQTRCQQMQVQVEECRTALRKVSEERDTLLEENMEMRRRLAHVQTVFAKQQLQTYRAAVASGEQQRRESGTISFLVRTLHCDEAMLRALGISSFSSPTSIFFSLDGLQSYDTMLSPTVYSLQEPMDFSFLYDGLDVDEVTIAEVQRATFALQLHRTTVEGSEMVAMAELPGVALLAARETPVEEHLTLIDGHGETLGRVAVELCCANLMLPVLLGRPLRSNSSITNNDEGSSGPTALLSADQMRAALISLRSIRFLRIQVFRAQSLAVSSPDDADAMPQPYIFYTAHAPTGGLRCIRDTVVHPASKAFTTDPVFDAAPVDHRVVVDRELVNFITQGTVTFVVFDERAKNVQSNLGVADIPLHSLLSSPQAIIRETLPLHPQGTISIGLSWVVGP